jgi:hypothetical protein
MEKRIFVLFLLLSLLSGCVPATAITRPTATIPPTPTTIPTQTRAPILESTHTTLPVSDFNLERIAQLGGSIKGITVMGDLAYVGMGPRVAAIDISQHEHPRLVRQSEPLPGLVTQLLQIASGPAPLLLVNAGRNLAVMDISNPNELKPIHQLELEAEISALVWDEREGMVYVGGSIYQGPSSTDYTGFISAVGITSDGDLNLMDSVVMPEWPLSIALAEGSLFAGAQGYEGGLYRIQLKTPGELSTPHLVIASTPERPLQPLRMQVVGKTLYLGYKALEAYDITDPDQPVQIWARSAYGGGVIDDFILAGEQSYVFGWTILSEYVYDVMTLPQPIVGSPIGEIASVTAIHNEDFLVAYNDLEIYDTAKQQDLQLVGSYLPAVANAMVVVANEEAVFVLDNGFGDGRSNAFLWVLSLPDLEPLGQVMTETPNDWPGVQEGSHWIALDGDRLYLASLDSVWVYDVSRMQPTLLGKAGIVDGQVDAIRAVKFGEKRLLAISQVVEDHLNVVTVYDLTDLQKPVQVGSPLTLEQGNTQQMVWNGSTLYVLLDTSYHSESDYLYVIGFDNNALTMRGSLKLENYIELMAVDNQLIGLVGVDTQMHRSLLSAVEPESLRLLSQTTLPEIGRGIAIIGDRALVAVGGVSGAQLHMYDIQDPADPRQVQAMDIPNSNIYRVSIFVTDSYVVLANGHGGVEVFSGGC